MLLYHSTLCYRGYRRKYLNYLRVEEPGAETPKKGPKTDCSVTWWIDFILSVQIFENQFTVYFYQKMHEMKFVVTKYYFQTDDCEQITICHQYHWNQAQDDKADSHVFCCVQVLTEAHRHCSCCSKHSLSKSPEYFDLVWVPSNRNLPVQWARCEVNTCFLWFRVIF